MKIILTLAIFFTFSYGFSCPGGGEIILKEKDSPLVVAKVIKGAEPKLKIVNPEYILVEMAEVFGDESKPNNPELSEIKDNVKNTYDISAFFSVPIYKKSYTFKLKKISSRDKALTFRTSNLTLVSRGGCGEVSEAN